MGNLLGLREGSIGLLAMVRSLMASAQTFNL